MRCNVMAHTAWAETKRAQQQGVQGAMGANAQIGEAVSGFVQRAQAMLAGFKEDVASLLATQGEQLQLAVEDCPNPV